MRIAPDRKAGSDELPPPAGPLPVEGAEGTGRVGVAVAGAAVAGGGVDGAAVAVGGRGVAVAAGVVAVADGVVAGVVVVVAGVVGVAVAPACMPTSMLVIITQSGRTPGCSQNTDTTDVPMPSTT